MRPWHVLSLAGIVLLTVLLLSLGWEFALEDLVWPRLVADYAREPLHDRWEYVITSTFFAGLALIIPTLASWRLVTDLDRAKQALRRSETRLETIAGNLPGCIYRRVLHADGTISYPYMSRGFGQTFDIDPAEVMADPGKLFDAIHSGERSGAQRAIERSGETLENYDYEYRLIGRSGDVSWVRSIAQPHREGNGAVVWDGIAVDITEQKKAETALRQSEGQIRLLIDSLPVLVSYIDTEQRYRLTNKAYEQWFGLRGEDIEGRHVREILGDSVYEEVRGRIAKALSGETVNHESWVTYRKAGKRYVHGTYVPHIRDDGRVDGLFALVADITEHKRTEEALREVGETLEQRVRERTSELQRVNDALNEEIAERTQAEEALRESEARFRAVVESSPTGILLKDLGGRFRLVNRRFEEWYGTTRKDVIGKTSHDIYPEALAIELVAQDADVLERMEAIDQEHIVRFGDGSLHTVVLTKFPVLDGADRPIGVGSIGIDITERIRLEEQIHHVQRMEAVGQLTAGIAHEFNNLMTAIMGFLELLDDGLRADAGLKRFSDGAMRSAERAADITQKLLAFGRKQPLRPRAIDLPEALSDVTRMLRDILGDKIELEIVHARGLWKAQADPGQVESAVVNLALNARDAMPEGGKLRIEIANAHIDRDAAQREFMAERGDYIVLAVSDTGCGMTPEDLEHAFEPFFTTKEVGQGTGLGLSMVHGFANQSKGFVTIDSEVGHGTRVELYLPKASRGEARREARP